MTQLNLIDLREVHIGNQTILDHFSISMLLTSPIPHTHKVFNWRLNPSLLTDPEIHQHIAGEISLFLGELLRRPNPNNKAIKWGARQKRARESEITRLIDKIATLEMQHKWSLAAKINTELLENCKSLQQILYSKAKHILFLRKGVYYECGEIVWQNS